MILCIIIITIIFINIIAIIVILILTMTFLVLEMYNMLILITSELDTIKLAMAKCKYEKL